MKIAIIGAGISGLTCAHEAKSAGHEVLVFDKGRGPGGRCSTRRTETDKGQVHFDHGAVGFQPRSFEIQKTAETWLEQGWIAEWRPRMGRLEGGSIQRVPDEIFYTGLPNMNGLVKGLCSGLDVEFGARVSFIEPLEYGYGLSFEDERDTLFCDAVVLAIPPEQCTVLLKDVAPNFNQQADAVKSSPCWTVMASFEHAIDVGSDYILGRDDSPFLRCVRNTSKPERTGQEAWVLQANTHWSADHVDHTKEAVCDLLLTDFTNLVGPLPNMTYSSAHRWLYGLNESPIGQPANWDEIRRVGMCGDWFLGADIEHAWLSGRVLGERLKTI